MAKNVYAEPSDAVLGDLKLVKEIGRGASSVVYLAQKGEESYAVKVLRDEVLQKDPAAISRFYREAGILARSAHKNLIKTFKVSSPSERPAYLVMELVKGEQLSDIVAKGSLDERRTIDLAIQIASALEETHRYGLVHRDLKPQNIMVTESGAAKVIDFGLALNDEPDARTGAVVGSLHYIAPEQSGVLNRSIDARADLYSLGVILFECLSGKVPFSSNDPGELIQLHLKGAIPDLREKNAQVSEAMSLIVAKLMAKDPDDRYRTASSLLHDLRSIEKIRETKLLGSADFNLDFAAGLPFVGRENELKGLLQKAGKARSGKGHTVIVAGEPGSGKSRMVREIVSEMGAQGAIEVLSAKASMANSSPYGAIRHAIDEQIHKVCSMPGDGRERLANALRTEMPDHVEILLGFSTSFRKILGESKKPVEAESQQQLDEALMCLLKVLASRAVPLVFIIDDIQWLDDSSRGFVRHAAGQVSALPILLLCSARLDAAGGFDPRSLLGDLDDAKFSSITLRPMDIWSTGKMISSYLGGAKVEDDLLRTVFSRSNGNAFAIHQFLSAMLDAGILLPHWGTWQLDKRGMESLHLPSDVIQLLLKRLENLSQEAREVLMYAAVLADHLDPEILSEASRKKKIDVERSLSQAVAMNLLESERGGKLKFVHDRIMEALLGTWDESGLKQAHQRIADVLHPRLSKDSSGDGLFAVARHYGLGQLDVNPERSFEANFQAGRVAFEKQAMSEAASYLAVAAEVFQWAPRLRTSDFEELRATSLLRSGKFREAEAHFMEAEKLSTEPLQRARIFARMQWLTRSRGEKERAWEYGDRAFHEMKVKPLKGGGGDFLKVLSMFVGALFRDKLLGAPKPVTSHHQAEKLKVLVEIAQNTAFLAFYEMKGPLMLLSQIRSWVWARHIGPSKELVDSYCYFAAVAGMFRWRNISARCAQRALTMAKEIESPGAIALARLYGAISIFFIAEDEHEIEARYREVLPSVLHTAEPARYNSAVSTFCQRLIRRGLARDILEMSALGLAATDSEELEIEMHTYRAAALALLGRISEASEVHEKVEAYLKTKGSPSSRALHTMPSAIYYLEQEEFGAAADRLIESYDASGLRKPANPDFARAFHIPCAHLRLNQWLIADSSTKEQRLKQLKEALANLKKFGGAGLLRKEPEALVQAHIWLVDAVIERETGTLQEAHAKLDQAEAFAARTDCQWILFEVQRHRAFAFLAEKRPIPASRCASVALAIAQAQGWTRRVERLKRDFKIDESLRSTLSKNTTIFETGTQVFADGSQALLLKRQLDALLELGISSSKVFGLEAQARQVMKVVAGLLSPERVFLFLYKKNSDQIHLQLGQDHQGNRIEEISGFSRTIVGKVRETRRPILLTSSETGEQISSESIVAHDLRSILAIPLVSGEELIGVLYLDSRIAKGIFTEKEARLLAAFGSHITVAIETARATQLELEKGILQKDLEVAGAVQSLLFPKVSSTAAPGIEISTFFQTATQAGGDWWWVDSGKDGVYRVLIADVTGHGVGSAMVTAVVAGCYQTIREQNPDASVSDVAATLNRILITACNREYWLTLSVLEIDPKARKVDWWTMGAPPIFVARKNEIDQKFVTKPGAPLGSGELKVSKATFEIEPGSEIMIFSDGLFEFEASDRKQFGMRRLKNVFKEALSEPTAAKQVEKIMALARDSMASPELQDDITLTVIKIA